MTISSKTPPLVLPPPWIEHDKQLKPYRRAHRVWKIVGLVLNLCLLAFLLVCPNAKNWASALTDSYGHWLGWLFFFAVIGTISQLLGLPVSYAHHRIEVRYQLSKQKLGSWLWDWVKGILVGAVLGVIVLLAARWLIVTYPQKWVFFFFGFLIFFSVALAQLGPVLLIPLFYELKPMPNGALKTRLFALCARYSVKVKEIYHLGMGAKTEKGNAAFTGIGPTKRIIIGDTLYEKFTEDEVEAVFAHELGHQVNNDLWKGIAVSTVLLAVGLYLTDLLFKKGLSAHWEVDASNPFGFLLFLIAMGFVQLPFSLLTELYSRSRERAADAFASREANVRKSLADALEKLTFQNKGIFKPNALVEFFTYSHPAPWRRITKLRG